jgi:hypothetical protein
MAAEREDRAAHEEHECENYEPAMVGAIHGVSRKVGSEIDVRMLCSRGGCKRQALLEQLPATPAHLPVSERIHNFSEVLFRRGFVPCFEVGEGPGSRPSSDGNIWACAMFQPNLGAA